MIFLLHSGKKIMFTHNDAIYRFKFYSCTIARMIYQTQRLCTWNCVRLIHALSLCLSSLPTLSLSSVRLWHSLGLALSNVCTMYIFVRLLVCALFSLSLELSGVLPLCVCLCNLCCCHFDSYATNNLRVMRIHLAFAFLSLCVCVRASVGPCVYESVNEHFFPFNFWHWMVFGGFAC